jgi:hypothetical protein
MGKRKSRLVDDDGDDAINNNRASVKAESISRSYGVAKGTRIISQAYLIPKQSASPLLLTSSPSSPANLFSNPVPMDTEHVSIGKAAHASGDTQRQKKVRITIFLMWLISNYSKVRLRQGRRFPFPFE